MAIQTLNYCTTNQIECSVFPAVAYLCVPASIVLSGFSFINATIESVRESTCYDPCGPCGFVYTITYDDAQLVPGMLLVAASIRGIICDLCLVDILQSLTLTFNDTPTIEFTVSGTGVSADVLISADVGNCLEERADGLYTPCLDAVYNDTASVDFTVVGSDVSADVILSPNANNALVSLANGLFVAGNLLTVLDSSSVNLGITGVAPQQLTAVVTVSPNANNALTSLLSGLFVDENILTVTDSSSVNLTITGTAPQDITASVIVSPDANNALTSLVNGLFVDQNIITVTDSSSVNLTVTGTAPQDVTASVIVSSDVSNLLETRANGLWVPAQDGWIPFNDTLTRTGLNTFTIPGDWTDRLTRGDKIKLLNPTQKYFYVVAAPVFALGVTTVTVSGGDDYTLAVGAITSPFFSHAESLGSGFPNRFTYTAAPTGFSVDPTHKAQFYLQGTWLTVTFATSVNGTSDDTVFAISLPVTSATDAGNQWLGKVSQATDNGVSIDTAFAVVQSASAVATLSRSAATPAWTAANAKGANFSVTYPIV